MGVASGPPSGPSASVFLEGTADSAAALLPLTAARVPVTLAQPIFSAAGTSGFSVKVSPSHDGEGDRASLKSQPHY